MNPYLLVLTEPFVAIPICLSLSALLLLCYAILSSENWQPYSRFLTIYRQMDVAGFLIIVSVIAAILSVFCYAGFMDSVLAQKTPSMGEGVYLYGLTFTVLLFFFCKAPLAERRDIRGLHKQQTTRLQQLITLQLEEYQTQCSFEGKTALQMQRILSEMKKIELEVAQQKKVRKNKENIYRSLERLDNLEKERLKQTGQMENLQNQIASLYDTLHRLEAIAFERGDEAMREPLLIAEGKLLKDPYNAQIYLQHLERRKEVY